MAFHTWQTYVLYLPQLPLQIIKHTIHIIFNYNHIVSTRSTFVSFNSLNIQLFKYFWTVYLGLQT